MPTPHPHPAVDTASGEPWPIDTPRLRLRRMQAADVAGFTAYRADPALARYQGWSPLSPAQAARFIESMRDQPGFIEETWLQITIATRSTDAIVGDIGLCLHAEGEVEIGFTLATSCHGKGYATEALGALADALWRRSGIERLIAVVDARNEACVRVLQRLGMRQVASTATVFKGEPCTELRYVLEAPRPRA